MENWSDLVESGGYVFQNNDYKIGVHNSLAQAVFDFVVNHNLHDLELFFRLAGFSAFTLEEMPDSISKAEVLNLSSKQNVPDRLNSYEEAKAYIESELGEGIISKYESVKKLMLFYRVNVVRNQLKKVTQQLEEFHPSYESSDRRKSI